MKQDAYMMSEEAMRLNMMNIRLIVIALNVANSLEVRTLHIGLAVVIGTIQK